MRDRFCSISLETLKFKYGIESQNIRVSIKADNMVGESGPSPWSDQVGIPRFRDPSQWDNVVREPVMYEAPRVVDKLVFPGSETTNWDQ